MNRILILCISAAILCAGCASGLPHIFVGSGEFQYYYETAEGSYVYIGKIYNKAAAGPGESPVLVRVTDTVKDANLGRIDAWNIFPVAIPH